MRVTYVAPNRAHHYAYALALARAGSLQKFVCGFSRFSRRALLPELGEKLLRADHFQTLFLASLKLGLPSFVRGELGFLSKKWLDYSAKKDAAKSDLVLFYSGTGLRTVQALTSTPVRGVVEAVNSHVLVQKQILQEEHERLGLPLQGFESREVAWRVKEYDLADGIICPSSFTRQSFIEQGIPAERVFTVPFGVDVHASREPAVKPDDTFRVLFVGQINIRKGVRYLLEAFKKLRHPKKELWIVGPMTDQSGIDDISLPEGVKFCGVLKGAELENAYRSSHVFVLPTIEEGLALVIGEALAHGLPVIATVNSGAVDLFADGTMGFLVPIRSPDAITAKLQLLADDRPLLQEMSARTQIRDQGMRSWETAGQDLVEKLHQVVSLPKRNVAGGELGNKTSLCKDEAS